jgi:hypothetical protein
MNIMSFSSISASSLTYIIAANDIILTLEDPPVFPYPSRPE